jgi:signal transduction histidine kinase
MPDRFSAQFARRMIPLSLFFGLFLAIAPPLAWGGLVWQRLHTQATISADHIAFSVGQEAMRAPTYWRYRLAKSVDGALERGMLEQVREVQITDCHGASLHTQQVAIGAPPRLLITARSPIHAHGEVIGYGEIVMADEALWVGLGWVCLIAALLGAAMAALLYLFPVRVVRAQSERLESKAAELLDAQQALQAANASLRARVEEAVDELRDVSARLVAVQDEERARMARELHDGISQMIAAIQLELGRADARPETLESARKLCRDTLTELRRTIHDLRPQVLEQEALPGVLRELCERFEERTGVATFFRHEGPTACPPAQAASALRVAQEALHNVLRHAGAEEVGVALRIDAAQLVLTVRDDGRGIDPAHDPAGHGLANMHTRARLLGGSCEIISEAGQGCTVRLTLPLSSPAEEEASG